VSDLKISFANKVNLSIAVCTFLAAVAACWSAYISGRALDESAYSQNQTLQLQLQSVISQNIAVYTERYSNAITEGLGDGINSVDGYKKLNGSQQSKVQIVDGLLCSLVDALYYGGDTKRADIWASYIAAIPGPLATGYPLEIYASHPKTKAAISKARENILKP
jgi:hypothetical protein